MKNTHNVSLAIKADIMKKILLFAAILCCLVTAINM
jgi:hypothetical protein